ncbi:hypothetical protein Pla52o_56140 [Novipirellula galeiformis]|uniref:Uncharacterized protein n=1 Tax=Novipirellula galeiformis TaxID=2528004 RepID=A0A5C6BIL2_9BACT|nr:hypothetical protein Pla52o_56140 [Novipirellula galeiformis]
MASRPPLCITLASGIVRAATPQAAPPNIVFVLWTGKGGRSLIERLEELAWTTTHSQDGLQIVLSCFDSAQPLR